MSLQNYLAAFCLLVVGVINVLPVVGVFSAERLGAAYGVDVASPDLELLLRHRALLFGLVGGLVLCSLWMIELRTLAVILAAISMLGFMLLAGLTEGTGAAMTRILRADMAGVFALLTYLVLNAQSTG